MEYVSPLLAIKAKRGTYRSVLVHVERRYWLARRSKVALRSERGWLGVEKEYVTMGSRVLGRQGTWKVQ